MLNGNNLKHEIQTLEPDLILIAIILLMTDATSNAKFFENTIAQRDMGK